MSKTLFAAAAALTLLAGHAVAADAPTMAVSTKGVNFDDRAQVQALYARVAAAADTVCQTNSSNPWVARADRSCIDRAVADAVRSANRPALTAYYENGAATKRFMASN